MFGDGRMRTSSRILILVFLLFVVWIWQQAVSGQVTLQLWRNIKYLQRGLSYETWNTDSGRLAIFRS
jgi:hypothetical protein